jgi:hypothetical protein
MLAVLHKPPAMLEPYPDAVLQQPPLTVEKHPLAVLFTPHLTVEQQPVSGMIMPPPPPPILQAYVEKVIQLCTTGISALGSTVQVNGN